MRRADATALTQSAKPATELQNHSSLLIYFQLSACAFIINEGCSRCQLKLPSLRFSSFPPSSSPVKRYEEQKTEPLWSTRIQRNFLWRAANGISFRQYVNKHVKFLIFLISLPVANFLSLPCRCLRTSVSCQEDGSFRDNASFFCVRNIVLFFLFVYVYFFIFFLNKEHRAPCTCCHVY